MDEKMKNSLREIPGYDGLSERQKVTCRIAYLMGRKDCNEDMIDFIDELEEKYGEDD